MQGGDHWMGHVLIGIAVLVWGANFSIIKSAYQDLHPIFK